MPQIRITALRIERHGHGRRGEQGQADDYPLGPAR
jgi:hypothetical protein